MKAKQVKKLIAKEMNNRKGRVSVALGECDDQYERILIHFPANFNYISLNPIYNILKKSGFYVAQVVSFWQHPKLSILLIREPKKK